MTSKRKGSMTLAEHDALLKAEGRYDAMIERQQQQDAQLQRRVSELRRAEAPLLEELRAAGCTVESAWDLVNTTASYSGALSILLDHLPRPYPGAVREGIARALAVRDAKFAWDALTRLYREEQEERVKDGLAVAIAAVADAELIGEVIALARDPRHGSSRLLLLSALERSADPRAKAALMELGTDPDLTKEVQVILRRLRRAERKTR
ncbi:MAG TPA: hypothetical protein VFG69_18260 [Nannocystaceae bacterium]|nr:hypothetical protein [Nannocystaceae bacterium]